MALTFGRAGGPTHPPEVSVPDALLATAREAAEALLAGWESDATRLQAGAAQLAGLGGGLTPAGDDFLTGAMLWGWLAHPDPGFLCRLLVEAAAHRTTTLSAAFLRAAARGECSAAWHMLLAALAHGSDEEIAGAVQDVLAHGATSGADALAGFLWAAPFVFHRQIAWKNCVESERDNTAFALTTSGSSALALWDFAWMTHRSSELVRVLCATPPTSWGLQYPNPAKSQRASALSGDKATLTT